MTVLLALASQAMMAQPGPPSRVIVEFTPGEVTCDGPPVRAVALARPLPIAAVIGRGQAIEPFAFSFRVDESGRPLGIVAEPRAAAGIYLSPNDLQPALSASRFEPAQARARCTIRYQAVAVPVAEAPIDLVYRYLALPHDRVAYEADLQRRARDASPGCLAATPPTVLLRGYPDFEAIPQPSGVLSMTMVAFDIDRAGRPTHVRTVTSDGNAALDAAGRNAVARSRFGKAARVGCTFPYYRRQSKPLAAPAPPPVGEYRRAGSSCNEDGGAWALPPRLTFPEPFRRRGIEGWAMIRYDVAPWGQTGNVTVLASEPAAAFGEAARGIIQVARRPASSTGATGCVDRVLFRLPEGMTEETPPPPAPIID